MSSTEIYNQLPENAKSEFDVKYSELKGDSITIYRTNENKWGALNGKLKCIIHPIYDSIEYQSDRKLFICINMNNDKSEIGWDYFFVNADGSLINTLSNIGFVNTRAKKLFPFRYSDSKLWRLLNETYNVLIEPSFENITPLNDNINVVKLNNKYGFITNKKAKLTDLVYDQIFINTQNPNRQIVLKDGIYHLINSKGEILNTLRYSHILKGDCNSYGGRINKYSNCLKTILNGDQFKRGIQSIDDLTTYSGLWGIIDLNGKEIITPEYNYIDFFNESNNFKVLIGQIEPTYNRNDKICISGFTCGVISDKEEIVLEAKYNWIDEISPSLYKVNFGGEIIYNDDYQENYWEAIGGKWGVLDNNGNTIVPIKYDNIMTNWFRVKDIIIVQNGAQKFDSNLEYEAYELDGEKIVDREINYLEHLYYR